MTCYNRFVRWRRANVWDQIMEALAAAHEAAVQMIDTSVVRVHQHGACIAGNREQHMGRSLPHRALSQGEGRQRAPPLLPGSQPADRWRHLFRPRRSPRAHSAPEGHGDGTIRSAEHAVLSSSSRHERDSCGRNLPPSAGNHSAASEVGHAGQSHNRSPAPGPSRSWRAAPRIPSALDAQVRPRGRPGAFEAGG